MGNPLVSYWTLPIPLDGFEGDSYNLKNILEMEFGPDGLNYPDYTVWYREGAWLSNLNFSYWDLSDKRASSWSVNDTDIGGGYDNHKVTLAPADIWSANYHPGTEIGPFSYITVPVSYDAAGNVTHYIEYSIISMDPHLDATNQPDPAGIVAAANRFAAYYPDLPNTSDCDYIAAAVATSAGATFNPNTSDSLNPSENQDFGFWRVAYRGMAGGQANWSLLVQPGDIVRMGWAGGGQHTATVLGATRDADGIHNDLTVLDNVAFDAKGTQIVGIHQDILPNGRLYDEATDPATITIYRLSPDHLYVINASDLGDHLSGTSNNDQMTGGMGNDMLNGWIGNDVLDGRGGHDYLRGGDGDDQYYLSDVARFPGTSHYVYDRVDEQAGGGIDTVHVSAVDYRTADQPWRKLTTTSYTLPDNVENAAIYGDKPFNVVGNDLINVINGNRFANIIDGRGGADTMAGNGGDDIYYVDDVGDRVIEHQVDRVPHGTVPGGTDTIISSVDYRALPDFVENLTLLEGSNAHSAIGNSLKNTIIGNSAANIINGGADTDTMTGGKGADTFVFSRGDGKDTITDFKIGEDHIDLHLAGVTTLDSRSIAQTWSGDAVITYDDAGDSITLSHVGKGQVQSNMASIFQFALPAGQTFDGTTAWGQTITGTAGVDTLTYATQNAGVYVDLVRDGGFSELARIEPDGSKLHGHMTGIENVTGATDYMNTLLGDDQDNILTGGDWVNWFDGRGGDNMLIGGARTDYADYADSPGPVTIDLSVGKAYHGGYVDTLVSIESFRGSYNGDTFIGSNGNDYYYDLGGHDTLYGNGGDDDLAGYAGDTIDGGAGRDKLGASYGDDLMTGGTEADTFVFRDGSLGRHEVTDFNAADGDRIAFSDYTVALNLRFGDDGHGNAVITYATRFGDATVVLDHVAPATASAHPEWIIS